MINANSTVKLTNEENIQNNRDAYKNACYVDANPQAVEPFDKEWGVGLSGNTPNPSPFNRINSILAITQKTTNSRLMLVSMRLR